MNRKRDADGFETPGLCFTHKVEYADDNSESYTEAGTTNDEGNFNGRTVRV
jgi:hypothetical protein